MTDENIGAWMARRQREVDSADAANARGREAWAASTLSGRNMVAARPADVRALGADENGQDAAVFISVDGKPVPIIRGSNGVLSDQDVAGVIFNETKALSGQGIEGARKRIAHTVINGDETSGGHRPKSAPTKVVVAPGEKAAYAASVAAVAAAKAERAAGVDPTNGARHFNFRSDPSRGPFKGHKIHTQSGPFSNSYPTTAKGGLPATGVYSNTYATLGSNLA